MGAVDVGLTVDDVRALLDVFEAASWQEMTIEVGSDQLHLSRRSPPEPTMNPTFESLPVTAPSIGLFWLAPSPDALPLVEIGMRVTPEESLGVLEVADLRRAVPAGITGVVTAILVENGAMVEYNQPLMLVGPDGLYQGTVLNGAG